MIKIYVRGDTNDGDYIAELSDLDNKDDLILIRRLQEYIKVNRRHNWSYSYGESESEVPFSDDEIDNILSEYIPYGEYGVHSIVEVLVLECTII